MKDRKQPLPPYTLLPLEDMPYPPLVAHMDLLLLGIRWIVIFILAVLSWIIGDNITTLRLPGAIWFIVVAYNIPISVYIYRTRPVLHRRARWLLLGDILQAFVSVWLTGGYRSFYFFLFLLVSVELALILHWKKAIILLIIVTGLEAIAMSHNARLGAAPYATYLFVGKFSISLLVGTIAITLGELIRREMKAQQESAQRAQRVSALHHTLQRMAESRLNTQAVLQAILEGAKAFSSVRYALILQPGEKANEWIVMASTDPTYPVGTHLQWNLPAPQPNKILLAGPCFHTPLPDFALQEAIASLIAVPLQPSNEETLGLLVLAREHCQTPTDEERLFLLSLAQEAALGLRNARLYAQEQEHLQNLKRFEELQATFFSAMGHELKTPLAVLKMLIPSFRHWDHISPEAREETLHTIEQNLARLERLVSDILESARLEAGVITLYLEPLHTNTLVGQAVREVRLLAQEKKIRLLTEKTDCALVGDRRRLREVLVNLLVNAIKFSPPGADIFIRTTCDEDTVHMCVEDEGPGVPDEDKNRIFEKFYTATSNKALAGTGLGLYISAEIVRLHRGRIWVEDREGGGSRFCFRIPRHASEKAETLYSREEA